MPFIPIPNGIKVCMRFTKAGQQCCNVFYVKTPNPPDTTLLNTIGSVFKTAWNANLQGYTSQDVTLDAIEVTDQSVAGGIGIEYTTGLPLTGNTTLGAMPNNVTIATKLLTGLTGRAHRGRFYMIGVPATEVATDKQHISTTLRTQLMNFVEVLAADLITEGLELVIASLYQGVDANKKPIPRTSGILTTVIGEAVNLTLDSQRRRLPERGQ